ncbi:hypothetical protein [Tropicimonas sp. IMCC6043]|uniref:hypothetical protein n=1 Tax=Tropicimonas sp. IMCC6043 TaxID=2510645 RepID=UPI00101C5BF4|nr:hypothetical protein [Tropicimonas sp. IMCC6043]RYH06529.1 hypothetical protein EU800_23620 [Tropicimonas sp. IMCC6043]
MSKRPTSVDYDSPPRIGTRHGGARLARVENGVDRWGNRIAVLHWRQQNGETTITGLRVDSSRGPSRKVWIF